MANTTQVAAKAAAKEDAPKPRVGPGRPKRTPEETAARRAALSAAQLPRLQKFTDRMNSQVDAYKVRVMRLKAIDPRVRQAAIDSVRANVGELVALAATINARTVAPKSRVDLSAIATQ